MQKGKEEVEKENAELKAILKESQGQARKELMQMIDNPAKKPRLEMKEMTAKIPLQEKLLSAPQTGRLSVPESPWEQSSGQSYLQQVAQPAPKFQVPQILAPPAAHSQVAPVQAALVQAAPQQPIYQPLQPARQGPCAVLYDFRDNGFKER